MDEYNKRGYEVCEDSDFPLAIYKVINGIEVPICGSQLYACNFKGVDTDLGFVCRGALKRDVINFEKNLEEEL